MQIAVRLNLWQRLGTVLSVLWALTVGALVIIRALDLASKRSEAIFRACMETSGYQAVAQCMAKSEVVYRGTLNSGAYEALFSAFLPPIFGWGIAYATIATAKWVWAGRKV
jgi:hypothetical protein